MGSEPLWCCIPFFKTINSQYFFTTLSWVGPWVSRTNWCKRHQCDSINIFIRLSDKRPKTSKNAFFVFFACFRPYVELPDNHIGWALLINWSYWPKDQFCEKILIINGFERAILFLFSIKKIALSHEKQSKVLG
jgi:hypothetical protein